jgi:asparagine synthase (glutamine-hydrolysing)
MCGIVGVIGPRATLAQAEAMCAAIVHRGPDSDGFYTRPGVALGMRRLSIIDLAGGDQPIHNENRTVWTVYNGEIYNFPTLKKELEALGHEFYTRTDTELLVHCYEEYGTGLCGLLRGMFAFALWDESNQQLIVARDRLGEKPLYYTQVGDTLFLASEIKALLCCDDVPQKIDSISVDQYFTLGYVPGPRTMYEGISKLLPGHRLVFSHGRMEISKYWEILPGLVETPNGERAEEWLEWLEAQLDEAVRLRLISDVPLGAFLSGGLDSSLVVALMRRHVTGRLKTFSVAFDEAGDYDERQHAKAVASHFETDHYELVAGASPPDLLTKVVWHLDEPIADPAAVPTYLVSQEARHHVKVVLTGEGADELFAGYGRYSYVQRLHDIQSRLPRLVVRTGRALFPLIPDWDSGGVWVERAKKVMSGLFLPPNESYLKYGLMTERFYRERLYSEGLRQLLDSSGTADCDPRSGYFAKIADQSPLNQALFLDTKTWLPDELLMKVDKMSMANSLEARAPYLDHHLVEGAFRMPDSLKVRNGVFKYILRRFGQDVLPQSIWGRQKHGFIVPYREWFSGPLKSFVYDVLNPGKVREHGLFDPAGVRHQLRDYFDRKVQGEKETRALWALLCFQLWYESGIATRALGISSCAAGTLASTELIH